LLFSHLAGGWLLITLLSVDDKDTSFLLLFPFHKVKRATVLYTKKRWGGKGKY